MGRQIKEKRLSNRGIAGRMIGSILLGTTSGVASALVRPMADLNGFHVEAVAVTVLLSAYTFVAVLDKRRVRAPIAWPLMHAELFLVWGSFTFAWCITTGLSQHILTGYWWDDLLGMSLGCWLANAAGAAIILGLMHWYRRPMPMGPYCPQCGYCLIGLSERRCPECGRTFTVEELGIRARDLNPEAGGISRP
jgi:hypothetical protein